MSNCNEPAASEATPTEADFLSQQNDSPGRRSFLGGMGALGVSVLAGLSATPAAHAAGQADKSKACRLDSVGTIEVTREQQEEIPGGKEYFYEWKATDPKGAMNHFVVHSSRVDYDNHYVITTNITIHKFAPGTDPEATPDHTSKQSFTAYATRGEVVGNVRHDSMIMTTVHGNGETYREEKVIPVRLDLGDLASKSLSEMITIAGKQSFGSR